LLIEIVQHVQATIMNTETNDVDLEAIGSPPRVFGIRLDLIGLVCGPVVMGFWLAVVDLGLPPEAHRLAGVLLLTIIWWITEPVPIAITGLLALALAVVIGAVKTDGKLKPEDVVFAKFSSSSFFFLLGGMFIGRSMSRHGLDRRIALSILTTRWAGSSPLALLAAVGAATALISMWIANVAATAMIYPVAMGMISVLATSAGADGTQFARSRFASALLLMTAYASTIGGLTTPIGTATNVIAIGFFEQSDYFGKQVSFFQWSLVGLPLTVVLYFALTLWLRWLGPPGDLNLVRLRDYLATQRGQLGPWSRGEKNTLLVFLIVVSLWVAPAPLSFISSEANDWFNSHFPESSVAIFAPVLLYLLPVDWRRGKFTLEAADFLKIDWGTLALFGAGLCLGSLMQSTGLAEIIAKSALKLIDEPDVWKITALAIAGGILLSEITSNTATAAALVPITFALCEQANIDKLPPLMGVTLGASFGNALPVSTPPNAIVYSSGLIQIRRMVVSGLGLDILSGVLIWCVLRIAFELGWTPWISQ
jgi:solute carrier family 13 (sodium-dependent dicarboxylate transporter), member 2/3/5